MSEIQVATVGHGRGGRNVTRNLGELGVLACICDESTSALQNAAERYPGVSTTHSFNAVHANYAPYAAHHPPPNPGRTRVRRIAGLPGQRAVIPLPPSKGDGKRS